MACFVKILPVAPFAPKMAIFILFSFLVLYLHNQVMLFPLSRDSFVLTTTCGHHKERGLRGPFWDNFPIEFCPCQISCMSRRSEVGRVCMIPAFQTESSDGIHLI